jgi:hypothetical protein
VKVCPLCPSEFSVLLLDHASLPLRVVLFWNQVPVQSCETHRCIPLLLSGSRCAVSSCLGCAVFLRCVAADTVWVIGCVLSSSLPVPLEFYPATPTRPSQRPSPLMGFRSLQHIKDSRSTCRGRLSPPATFRLQGLATLLTACSLESRAGFVSHRRRSWDSPFGGLSLPEGSRGLSTSG